MTTINLLMLNTKESKCNFHTPELHVEPNAISFIECGSKCLSLVTKEGRVYTNGIKDGQLTELKQPPGSEKYKVSEVESGLSHHVALTTDHNIITWGKNNQGQLGRRTQKGKRKAFNFNNVSLVPVFQNTKVLKTSCGDGHTMCLSEEGHVYTWGANDGGQLGRMSGSTDIPQIVKVLENIHIVLISAGGKHSVALSALGQVFCWGSNKFGQLGLESEESSCSIPAKGPNLCGRKIDSICCGENHTAILTQDGCVFTFGLGSSGQCGHDSRENEFQPRRIEHLKNVSQIACGRNHTLAWIKSTNQLHIFGFGEPQIIDVPNQHLTSTLVCGGMFSFIYQSSADEDKEDAITRCDTQLLTLDLVHDVMNQNRDNDGNGGPVCSESDHGVDLERAELFFTKLRNSPYYNIAKKALIEFLQNLTNNQSPGYEMLRLYLLFPCCLYLDNNVYDDEFVSSLANHILCLDDSQKSLLGEWLKLISTKFFKRTVWFFKMRVIKALNRPHNAQNDREKLKNCVQVLDTLNKINHCRSEPIQNEKFYIKDLLHKINIEKDFKSFTQDRTKEDNSKFRFCKYPFLYNSGSKFLLLECQCKKFMEEMPKSPQLTVNRCDPISGTRRFKNQYEGKEVLHQKLNVLFEDETPTETGDGIRQEYFRLLFEKLVNPDFRVFYYEEKSELLWFNKDSNCEDVYLTGLMCGLALYNSVIVHLKFPAALYKKLLKQPVTFEDLSELKPQIHIQDDVNNLTDYHLNTSVEKQFETFRKGFYTGIPEHLLSSFHPKELEEVLIGNDNYDFRALENVTNHYWEDYKNDKTIKFFWEVIHELELEDQKAFLRYVTGTDRIPAYGMERMTFTIMPRDRGVQPDNPDVFLPFVWTCFNSLHLPRYTNKESLKMQILCVIRSDSEFNSE